MNRTLFNEHKRCAAMAVKRQLKRLGVSWAFGAELYRLPKADFRSLLSDPVSYPTQEKQVFVKLYEGASEQGQLFDPLIKHLSLAILLQLDGEGSFRSV